MLHNDEAKRGEAISRRKLLASLGAAGLAAAAGAVLPGTVQAATTTVNSLYYNVKDYGAAGNDRISSDDTAAIQAAIDAAAKARGGTVFFPPGQYTINSTILLKSNVRLLGAGAEAASIKLSYNAGAIAMLYGVDDISNLSVECLTLEGTGAASGTNNYMTLERGVTLQNVKNARVAGCVFKTIVNGIYLNNSTGVTVADCSFRMVVGAGGTYEGFGILCQSGGSHLIQGNRFMGIGQSCIQLASGCSQTVVAGNFIESPQSTPIVLTSTESICANNVIKDNVIAGAADSSASYGILLSAYCYGTSITGNVVTGIAKAGIRLEGAPSVEKERPNGNRVNGNAIRKTAVGISVFNAEDNAITDNDIRNVDDGIVLDASESGPGGFSRKNFVVGNGLFQCAKSAVKLMSPRCEGCGVFGNFGGSNGENLTDKGTGTVTAGF
ncbi:glycosyl hydrolase family 28-related protein [Paenibacillus hamazuiensis]|uniref:glycosyl hydrolase family 28-related protein n=1 Tax=Paenibacillus hamazuiensis TaxID=2936508 RepID=UPI00200C92F9|nr:glycosyl hydrolase family 28-related protein [Paenibacillus hamazuiensis]